MGMSTSQDAEWVSKIRSGDLDAFEALYCKYKRQLFQTALAITGDVGAAEEVLQDGFVRAYAALDRVDTTLPLSPWLHRIVVNLAYNWTRRNQHWPLALDALVDHLIAGPTASPERAAEGSELSEIVRAAVAALGPGQRVVVVLYYYQGFSLSEIALILECPIGTVKSRLHRACEALRNRLSADRRMAGEMAYATV